MIYLRKKLGIRKKRRNMVLRIEWKRGREDRNVEEELKNGEGKERKKDLARIVKRKKKEGRREEREGE